METRYNQLVLISKRAEAANNRINEIINTLGWDRQDLKKRYSRDILHKSHSAKKKKSSLFFYKNASSVISFVDTQWTEEHKNIIDASLLKSLQESKIEKCQLYDQVIQRSNQLRQPSNSNIHDDISQIVYEKQQKEKKKRKEQERSNKPKKHRIKMKVISATELQKELIDAYMQTQNKN
ncbi:uncharacterized protein B0P05DRAFT_563031 [Gilbertella persicaria]|uniref:uncharacterized protein n=1 Tax=Gilbertella persicaria TaxID=101096 RepID=UPI0022211F85|nr:uncharacterized protein B0P05DRAFT_563031 [Gilbertella persicaria]KAI8050650.1 hypothetical protein B0P05DRAFT_563031 [Gilbertella persicaria]